jgi:diacylglycerol kinase (ATP)
MNNRRNICFIINPISGIGRQKTVEKLVKELLDTSLFEPSFVYTEGPKHATSLARKAASENYSIVVAVGGDGSVNEIANGLIGSNTAMGILPAGSGNGLARHLGIPMDLKKAIDILQKGAVQQIDTIQLNKEHFVNIAGIGFDAHIGWEFSKFGKRGLSSYVKVILRELSALKTNPYKLQIDEQAIIQKEAYLISFANGSQWGNNAYIAPLADIKDGVLDIVIIKKFPFLFSLPFVLKLFTRKIHTSSAVEIIKAKKVIVTQEKNIAHIDGEPIECGHTITIMINPLSLNVIAPSS